MIDTTRRRLLLVTRNFPPLRGGMERLNQRLLDGVATHSAVALAGPEGCADHAPPDALVVQTRTSPLPWFLVAGAARATLLALRFRPRVVLAGSGLTVPLAWLAARLVRARLAVYLHGLDILATNPVYRRIWKPWLAHCDLAFANSENTARLARDAGVDPIRIRVVHPGTDIPALDPQGVRGFREKHGLGDAPVLLSIGRLTPRKGLAEFISGVFPSIVARVPDVRLLVMGHDAEQALKHQGHSESKRIRETVEAAGMQRHVMWLPPCDDNELAVVYQASDVHVFPVRAAKDDVEGFGMVAIEAAANGVPTVAYAEGGVPDAIVDGVSGRLVASGDANGFCGAVVAMVEARRDPGWSARCRQASARFTWSRFDDQIARALDSLGDNGGNDGY